MVARFNGGDDMSEVEREALEQWEQLGPNAALSPPGEYEARTYLDDQEFEPHF
jgi:hypothetical protein